MDGRRLAGQVAPATTAASDVPKWPATRAPCAGLTALRHLDLSSNRLASPALASACCSGLTCLRLASNRLTADGGSCAGWLPPLPSLLQLDISRNSLTGLEGLATAAPLLRVLAATGNRIACLPPAMHLPFLQELWLGGNALEAVPAWPWLPSLQALYLNDNRLASLAAMQV